MEKEIEEIKEEEYRESCGGQRRRGKGGRVRESMYLYQNRLSEDTNKNFGR